MSITKTQTMTTPIRTSSANTLAGSFNSLPLAGSTVIVYAIGFTGSSSQTLGCADNQGNTYTIDKQVTISKDRWVAIFRSSNIGAPSGTFTCTVTAPGTASKIEMVGVEIGANLTPDQSNSASATSTAPAPGAVTTAIANEYLATCMVSKTTSASITSPAVWTSLFKETSSTFEEGEAMDQIVSATQTGLNPTWTTTSAAWSAVQQTYSEVATGGILPRVLISIPEDYTEDF